MKKITMIKYATLVIASLGLAQIANAGNITNCTGGSGDYSDAPASYGVACHDTNKWQQLGDIGTPLNGSPITQNDFNNVGWTSEGSPNANDAGDNGVMWRTSSDGINWSSYGQSEHLVQGQFVQFQIDVNRSSHGGHNFDEYKLWLDWFGTGTFNESDVVANEKWVKNETSDGTLDTSSGNLNGALGTNNSAQEFASFFSSILTVPTDSILGQVWLRARIACDFSYTNSNGNDLFATGYYHQGEVEDYALKIVKDVNAPAMALLVGLFAMGLVRRRMM